MDLRIAEEPVTVETLRAYATVPIAFRVESVYRVEAVDGGLGGIRLVEESVAEPYEKEWPFDGEDGGPVAWAKRWDTSTWAVFVAYDGERRIGGAVVAPSMDDMWFIPRRDDTAALWDLRVEAACRGRGVGHALFDCTVDWARQRSFRRLMIESQNTNVRACKFYARQGCYVGAFEREAYEEHRDDIELTWYYDL